MRFSAMALPIASAQSTFLFNNTIWLGGRHDFEHPLLSLQEYESRFLDATRPHIAAQFQCVFTFGLLEAVLETKVSENELLSEDRTTMTCTRLRVPALLQAWRDRIRVLGDTEASRAWAERAARTLEVAHGLLQIYILPPQISTILRDEASFDDMTDIFGAIGSIAEALFSSTPMFPVQVRPNGLGVHWAFLRELGGKRKQSMINLGWCPFIIRNIHGSCVLQYASTFDTSTYRVRHTPDCKGCTHVLPPVAEMMELLESGSIPVIRLRDNHERENPILISLPFTSTSYVAISHVWSDGLGSTTETGLPSCQVRRIAQLVAQGHAIILMAETYRRAEVVLVIDSGIRTCSIHAPLEEKLLRIVTCGWMQRLWTLQEAMLAGKLMFEFLDGIVNVADLIPSGEELFNPLYIQLSGEVFRLRSYQASTGDFGLAQLARLLKWRSTSKVEDEILAICGLVGVSATELVNLSGEERMKKFLLQIRTLPRDIPFLISPKLNEPNFRWAPRTLMTKAGTTLSFAPNQISAAMCTPSGLVAVYSVVYFDKTEMRLDDSEWFVHHKAKDLRLKVTYVPPIDTGDAPEVYECNALLFMQLPRGGSTDPCIAVSVTPLENSGNLFRCQYRTRLVALSIGELELRKATGRKIMGRGSGAMQVIMV
ncbi:hypothetical protein C8R45DRAFT_1214337 [Mycena sanguinolenta]|nr:hypothetical protein C8R45DRAFT_1214337 [Mycena sanguinolenta]